MGGWVGGWVGGCYRALGIGLGALKGNCAAASMHMPLLGLTPPACAEHQLPPPVPPLPALPAPALPAPLCLPAPALPRRFGAIFDYELQPATHEKGRTDQWGFVNYKRLGDAARAYEGLMGEVSQPANVCCWLLLLVPDAAGGAGARCCWCCWWIGA